MTDGMIATSPSRSGNPLAAWEAILEVGLSEQVSSFARPFRTVVKNAAGHPGGGRRQPLPRPLRADPPRDLSTATARVRGGLADESHPQGLPESRHVRRLARSSRSTTAERSRRKMVSTMKCEKCGRDAQIYVPPKYPADVMVLGSPYNHGDMEGWAMYCGKCATIYCGSCCLPKWEALKQTKKLTGKALAAQLEADPNAFFTESPKCPVCGGSMDLEIPADKRGCFIATACCGSPDDPRVQELRRFRDEVLEAHAVGRALGGAYLRLSPPLAAWLRSRPWARVLTRNCIVQPLAGAARRWGGRHRSFGTR